MIYVEGARGRALVLAAIMVTLSASSQYELQSALTDAVPCGDKAMEDKLREIMQRALDEALKEHIKNTFEVWMRDDRDQPQRAARGVRGGVNAYIQATNSSKRWRLRECPGGHDP